MAKVSDLARMGVNNEKHRTATAARATKGSESLSVIVVQVSSDEHDVKHGVRSGKGAATGEE